MSTGSKKLGRPSEGRSVRLQAAITPELNKWLESQVSDENKSVSEVAYRILEEMRLQSEKK